MLTKIRTKEFKSQLGQKGPHHSSGIWGKKEGQVRSLHTWNGDYFFLLMLHKFATERPKWQNALPVNNLLMLGKPQLQMPAKARLSGFCSALLQGSTDTWEAAHLRYLIWICCQWTHGMAAKTACHKCVFKPSRLGNSPLSFHNWMRHSGVNFYCPVEFLSCYSLTGCRAACSHNIHHFRYKIIFNVSLIKPMVFYLSI